MHIRLLCVGRIRTTAIRTLVDEFLQRLRAYHTLEEIEVRATAGTQPEYAILVDTTNMLERIDPSERVWLLDREGTAYSSPELAGLLAQEKHLGIGRVTLVVGGAYGFDQRLQARADIRWSLSPLTFLHEWARAMVVEQIYRGSKILRNEPYHH